MSVLSSVLGPNLRGLYAFGSAVDGGLRPASDLDFLAVVDRSLDDGERLDLARALSAISGRRAGGRSLEVVVVVADRLRPWTYPPTADFLYGDWLRDQLLATPGRPVANATLAIDLHQALSTGVVLFGEPLPPAEATVERCRRAIWSEQAWTVLIPSSTICRATLVTSY